jgi:RNA polymerase sigma factor (sigma-70 family)
MRCFARSQQILEGRAVTGIKIKALRRIFIDRYDELKARLTLRLGSADLASDAMNETWLRLTHTEAVAAVRSPDSYLFRAALNTARDQRRSQKRILSAVEIDSLFSLEDETPGPERVVESVSSSRVLERILSELPARRRAILLASRLDGLPREQIAAELGVSIRLVSKELRLAHEYCVARFKEIIE